MLAWTGLIASKLLINFDSFHPNFSSILTCLDMGHAPGARRDGGHPQVLGPVISPLSPPGVDFVFFNI